MTEKLLTYTYCDVTVTKPAVLSHFIVAAHVSPSSAESELTATSDTVTESMRVLFLDQNQKGCMRSTVVLDLSAVTPITYYKQSSKTYLTSLRGKDLLCLQTDKEFACRHLNLTPFEELKHPTFLLGQSVSIGASQFEGVGNISILRSLVVSTYQPLKPESTFALFEKLTTDKVISTDLHLYFKTMGYVDVPLAYTSDTSVTDLLYTSHMRLSALEAREHQLRVAALTTVPPAICFSPLWNGLSSVTPTAMDKMQYDPWPPKLCNLSDTELGFFDASEGTPL